MGILPNIMDVLKRIEALQVNGPHEVPNAVIAQQLVALNNDLIKVVGYLKDRG
jgi:hypothetical protein